MKTDTCERCRFWDHSAVTWASEGLCRARPPSVGASPLEQWPTTRAEDWCGSWREDKEAMEKRIREHDNFERGSSWAGHAPKDAE